jgi:hypothetical protein
MQQLLHVQGIFSLDQNEKNGYLGIYITTFHRHKKLLGFFKDTPIQISKRRIFCFTVHTMYIIPIFRTNFHNLDKAYAYT